MKTTYQNKEQLTGAVNTLTSIYDENVNRIDDEKLMYYSILDLGDRYKVEAEWISEIKVSKYGEETIEPANDFFYFLKTETATKLEGYVNDLLNTVTQNKVQAA